MAAESHPFTAGPHPIALAHRGGARESPENSRTAFQHAADLGYRYIETDIRATRDGTVVVFHDASLNRVTDRFGRISALPYSEVRKAKISGGDPIMTLEELFNEFPEMNFNIDVKDDHTIAPFVELVQRLGVGNRVCVATFSAGRIRNLRSQLGTQVAFSLAPPEVASLVAASRMGPLSRIANIALPPGAQCAQVPIKQSRLSIITPRFVDAVHKRGLAVHVWTVDDERTMNWLLDLGVDGIVTDRPTVLKSVMQARGYWDQ